MRQLKPRPGQIRTPAQLAHGPFITTYEQRLSENPRWALNQGSEFFEGKSAVQDALRKITRRLGELGIPYTVVGGMALFRHGYRRFTEDVDLLVTREGLRQIHEKLDGLGYVPPFAKSKNLRDTENGVKIEFLIAGDFPGDGKPKPVAFPDPGAASFDADGVRYLNLDALITLKLASGMTAPGRARDLSDVMELIKALGLSLGYADQLDPYVQAKYRELWPHARSRFVLIYRKKIAMETKTIEQMIRQFPEAAQELEAMQKDGVILDPNAQAASGHARLLTTDPKVAEKYGMIEESELWDEPDNAK
jgi:hypothetical protein